MLYGLARSTVDVDALPAVKRSAWVRLANLAGKGLNSTRGTESIWTLSLSPQSRKITTRG